MKKVTLTVVAYDESDANFIARQMEDCHIAQEGIYTLTCGHIEDLTPEEEKEVLELSGYPFDDDDYGFDVEDPTSEGPLPDEL